MKNYKMVQKKKKPKDKPAARPCPPWHPAMVPARGSAVGPGAPCAPHPAQQHPEAVRGH